MNKIYFQIITCFICFFADAQTKVTLKGKLLDKETSTAIADATVYITSVKDSTVIDYTVSDKNGNFKIDTKKITVPFFMKISATGYGNYTIKENSCTENKDFGVISISKKEIVLSEVVVKNEAPPVKIKKDTLEFNAASFKVRPDANVEALIRRLPGASIDENKNITINGKAVDKILVNGKPFFSEDGKIALQNLTADMIKKVQVSNTKTKEEEMTKQESSSNTTTINLVLQEDKNKGFFGKFMAGYGTDDRYETSGIASYFKNKRRITAIASSNNINATGFSMDDVFDNMGGGRNNSSVRFMGGNNSNSGNSAGITRSSTVGLNYDDEFVKDFNSHMAYNYRNLDNENRNKTSRADFLPSGNIFTESESASNQLNEGHDANFEFDYKINDKTRIIMNPKMSTSSIMGDYNSHSSSRDDNNQLMNESSTKNNSKSDSDRIDNWLYFSRTLNKKGRFFNASLSNSNSKKHSDSFNNSITKFYQDATPDDIRNQNVLSKNSYDRYGLFVQYSEPITDSLSVSVSVYTNSEKSIQDDNTFDFDNATAGYSDRNELLSKYYNSRTTTLEPSAAFMVRKKNLTMRASIGTYSATTNNHSNYLGINTDLEKSYAVPNGSLYLNYKLSKSKSFYSYYYRQIILPSAQQLLPVIDLSNPLNTIVGNSNLNPGKSHFGNLGFSNFDTARNAGLNIYANANYRDSGIVTTSFYDENGKQTTTYTNVSGTYNFNGGANWDKTYKKELNTFKYSLKLNGGYELAKGYTNTKLYSAEIKSLNPGVSFSYDYGTFFTLRPSYNFTFSKTNYDNYSIDETSNKEHNFKIEATNYFYKQWVFGNDFSYNYNSNISGGFKKDFYLWNISFSYKSKDDNWIFKAKVYDILDQYQSVKRTIGATSIVDSENTVLKRYAMLSLTYKFKKFGKKLEIKEEEGKKETKPEVKK